MMKNKKVWIIVASIMIVLGVGCYLGYTYLYDTVYTSCVVEIGYIIEASDFEKQGYGEIYFTEDEPELDTNELGIYEVQITKGAKVKSKL